MKRLHIHVGVNKIDEAIKFYSALFGKEPVKTKVDYAKWLLEDPRVNFAISTRAKTKGVDHLGIQVDEDSELVEIRERMTAADMSIINEGETVCCYAKSDKTWVTDPAGIPWETYRTMEDAQLFSGKTSTPDNNKACCPSKPVEQAPCCIPSEKPTSCGSSK